MRDFMIQAELQLQSITAADITRLLAVKHRDDLFIPQCKTGASWGGPTFILDAWVMPRSWVKPFTGYEIKISRSDFKRDEKWRYYLEYCHLFYFVTPYGLIEPREVPPEAGLCYVTKNGQKIRTVKKAPFRWWHPIPTTIFQYVLMWRAKIVDEAEKPEPRDG